MMSKIELLYHLHHIKMAMHYGMVDECEKQILKLIANLEEDE